MTQKYPCRAFRNIVTNEHNSIKCALRDQGDDIDFIGKDI